jgi:hypothetical protein
VRQLLRDAVPFDLEADPHGLIDGAAAYARRTRAARTAAGAVAAVVAVSLIAGVWMGGRRPEPEPARPAPNPVTQELCRDPRTTAPPAQPAADLSGEAAAICPIGNESGEGWVLPGAPLTLERWVDYLRGGIASTPSTACEGRPAGPPFVVVVKRLATEPVSYRSSDLACGGREAVARYLAALAYQQADRDAAGTLGDAPHCSPPKQETLSLTTPDTTLRAVHAPGILCSYPLFDPAGSDRLVPRDYASVHLSNDDLAVINADLARNTFSTKAPAECAPSRQHLALRLQTPGAEIPAEAQVEFVGTCLDVLRLSGNALWWRPDPSTRSVLAPLLPAP